MQKNDRKSKNNKNSGRSTKGKIKVGLQLLVFITLLTIVVVMFYFYKEYGRTILDLQKEAKQKVRTSTEDTFKASQTSLVYDVEGNLITTLKAEKDVYYIDYEDIPKAAIDAMMVSEDRKFFKHNGVDYLANIRAAIALIKHKGEITQGASTITQQVARNTFLSHNVTYERKIEEIFAAQELEKIYSKTDIMEFYLNGIYFANGHYGIQAAALGYFSEGVNTLSLSQIVFLCAIPNNPNLYNPISNMDNTLKRRDRILEQLLEEGVISEEEYKKALNEKIRLNKEKSDRKNYVETYTYYSAIRALMKANGFEFRNQFNSTKDQEAYDEEYDDMYYRYQKELYTHGYRIYTSIDLKKQELLQKSVDDALSGFKDTNEEGIYQMQGAAVCIDNDSGRVVAIVGGREQESQGYTLNRGYQSFRQPGSAIKPLVVYTPAFERDYIPESIVDDKKMEDGPKNSGGNYLGKMKLQRAIELSKNTVAWNLFEELTPRVGLSYLLNMNFSKISESDYVPAASLGGLTIGASPVEMAAAYATLENDGYYRVPTCIIKIMDSEGNEIVGEEMETKQIYQRKASQIMTEALTGVIKNGTAQGLGLKNTISAGKTGTTNDKKDGWFVGYTPYYTTSVWVGFDMPKPVKDLTGSSYPGTIWHAFMEQIHDSSMKKKFELYDWRTEWEAKLEEEKRQREMEEAEAEVLKEEQEKEDQEDGAIVNVKPDSDTENSVGRDTETNMDKDDETVDEPADEENIDGVPEEEIPEVNTGEETQSEEGTQSEEEFTSEEPIGEEDIVED